MNQTNPQNKTNNTSGMTYEWSCYSVNDKTLHFTNGEVYFDMIKVPNADFYIGETPVTQELWASVMGDNPSHFIGLSSRPVENVSRIDCINFINKLNEQTNKVFHLPSVQDWMLAAKGGDANGYEFAGSNHPEEVGWFDNKTHPVKLKKPNCFGIYDMTGNVWEWTSDVVSAPEARVIFGQVPAFKNVETGRLELMIPTYYCLKGGSCVNGPRTSKLISTKAFTEKERYRHVGFRLAL